VEAVLHSCQLCRYMEVSCQFHTPADLPSGHSLTRRLRAPGRQLAHSGERIKPIEPQFLGNPVHGIVPILTELPPLHILTELESEWPCSQMVTCGTIGHLT